MAFAGLWVGERRVGSAKPGNKGGNRSAIIAHLAKITIFTVFNSMRNNTSGVGSKWE